MFRPTTTAFIITALRDKNGGVRRYQNYDGSLTAEGKKRYNVSSKTLKKLSKPESIAETVKNTNPLKDGNNCTLCVVASALRQSGYNVAANLTTDDHDLIEVASSCFNGAKTAKFPAGLTALFKENASKTVLNFCGNDKFAFGGIAMDWINANGMGHAISWVIKDGKVTFFDSQNPDESADNYFGCFDPNGYVEIVRLDCAEVNIDNILKTGYFVNGS